MSENRATKSGLARDVQHKLDSKYDTEAAGRCMQWVAQTTGIEMSTSGDMDNVAEQLKDGYVLGHLADRIKSGSIPANYLKKRVKLAFQQRELLELFTTSMKNPPLSVPASYVFATCDLYEKQNLTQVITCLEAVARKCLTADTPVVGFGPKEADANKRDFTEEQLAQGKSIIGLQMGSNKGASQSGQNFGKSRMIMD